MHAVLNAALPIFALMLTGFAQERLLSGDAFAIGVLVGLKLLFQPAVTAVLALYIFRRPAGLVASGRAAKRAADRIWAFTTAKLCGLQPGVTSGAILASHVVSVATVSALVAYLG
jgi:malonate transporter and related proteins